jgi:glycosyltransferase involved in cell wall biosynthesis
MPQVSIIIPTYNSATYLKQAIDSVLAQTHRDFEILVIDDGSTDDTADLMNGYGAAVRYLRQPNHGVATARNRGIEESRGEYVAFLDADDVWLPDKLERQIEALEQYPGRGACYTDFFVVAPDLTVQTRISHAQQGHTFEALLLKGNVVGTPSSVICRREDVRQVGGFDPSFSYGADWEMWIRLASVTEFVHVREPLVLYRQHDGNMSRNIALLEDDSVRLLAKGFATEGISQELCRKKQKALARNYLVLAGSYFHAGDYLDSFRCARKAVRLDFHQAAYILAFPLRGLTRLRLRQTKNAS